MGSRKKKGLRRQKSRAWVSVLDYLGEFFSRWSYLDINMWSLLSQLAHRARAYPGFRSMKWPGVFLLPLDGILVHRRSLPSNLLGFPQQFASIHLYSWVERGTMRVKCLAQEHNTMSLARARTQTARSRDEHTNQEATMPPTDIYMILTYVVVIGCTSVHLRVAVIRYKVSVLQAGQLVVQIWTI